MIAKKKWDEALLKVIDDRHGLATIAVLNDGEEVVFYDAICGYDFGDEFAHIQTNWNPKSKGTDFEMFYTNELIALLDHDTRAPLFRFPLSH